MGKRYTNKTQYRLFEAQKEAGERISICTEYFPSSGNVRDTEKIHSDIPMEQEHRPDSKTGVKA